MFTSVRRLLFVLVALCCAAFLWAQDAAVPPTDTGTPVVEQAPAVTQGAPKPGTWLPAEGYENWRYVYDVSGFKPGEYNIMVRVTDSAGNISFGGPFNIVVDPKSDFPIAR
ncbi:MAG TPA: hypothetical protein PLC54_06670, partial [Spirochaetales bacterium]|nr:hypothetical protein [Spirochaetales bacterium]